MVPVLSDGDFVLTLRLFRAAKVGELVVVKHKALGVLVKRVVAVDGNGSILLRGENTQSSSIEDMGRIERAQIKGRVLRCIRRS